MTSLDFTLSPEAVVRVHDALVCLAKFHESVGLEASRDKLTLSAINSAKTSSASFGLQSPSFFQSYSLSSGYKLPNGAEGPFTCRILNKALLSVFKGRVSGEGETSVERCEVSVQEQPEKTECRFTVKIFCRHGVKKTYKLTYEPIQVLRAVFDPQTARNRWKIGASVLKAYSEYFGPRAENLDIYHENGRAAFTCYTEKVVFKDEILKQPLHTSVAIDVADFEEFSVEEKVHTGISVKDFKAIILHAETLKSSITALYSHPTRPMQLSYMEHGMQSEFTLMTIGEYRGTSIGSMPPVLRPNTAQPPVQKTSQGLSLRDNRDQSANEMPPPLQPASKSFSREAASQRPARPSPPPPRASVNEESLFVTDDDDEEKLWGEQSFDQDEGELRWDSTSNNVQTHSFTQMRSFAASAGRADSEEQADEAQIAPTQQVSQIKGLFDE